MVAREKSFLSVLGEGEASTKASTMALSSIVEVEAQQLTINSLDLVANYPSKTGTSSSFYLNSSVQSLIPCRAGGLLVEGKGTSGVDAYPSRLCETIAKSQLGLSL